MLDRESVWDLCMDGYVGTAFARRVTTHLVTEPVLGVRFAEGEDRPHESFDDFFVRDCEPVVALASIAAVRPLPEHYVTVLDDRPGLVTEYQRGGYCLSYSELLMARDQRRSADHRRYLDDHSAEACPHPGCSDGQVQARVAAATSPNAGRCTRSGSDPETEVSEAEWGVEILVARTPGEAEWLNADDPQGLRWIPPENLADPRLSHYAVIAQGRPLARGRNLRLDASHSFVSKIYTAEGYRRRGLARSLMVRILSDDAARGAQWSVLQASAVAEGLYAGLGYRTVGTVHIFEPATTRRPDG